MKANIPLSFYYAVGLIPLTYLIVFAMLKLFICTKLYRDHFPTYHKANKNFESFVGYQSRDAEVSKKTVNWLIKC